MSQTRQLSHFALALSLLNAVAPRPAGAIPEGGTVAAGEAQIQQTTPTRLDVVQQSQRAVVDFSSFDVAPGELVFFQQAPDASILSRIQGGSPSQILGQVAAQGRLFLVNPSGIVFGQGAELNVGSLIASTASIDTASFMSGNLVLSQPIASDGGIAHMGSIVARDGGSIALLAPRIDSSGFIQARLGSVTLASGSSYALAFGGDGLLQVAIDAPTASALARATNTGMLTADGGLVRIAAETLGQVVDEVVNVDGVVQAVSAENRDGRVVLSAGGGDLALGSVGATLNASGAGTGTIQVSGVNLKAGRLTLAGRHAELVANEEIEIGRIEAPPDPTGRLDLELVAGKRILLRGTDFAPSETPLPVSVRSSGRLRAQAGKSIEVLGLISADTGIDLKAGATSLGDILLRRDLETRGGDIRLQGQVLLKPGNTFRETTPEFKGAKLNENPSLEINGEKEQTYGVRLSSDGGSIVFAGPVIAVAPTDVGGAFQPVPGIQFTADGNFVLEPRKLDDLGRFRFGTGGQLPAEDPSQSPEPIVGVIDQKTFEFPDLNGSEQTLQVQFIGSSTGRLVTEVPVPVKFKVQLSQAGEPALVVAETVKIETQFILSENQGIALLNVKDAPAPYTPLAIANFSGPVLKSSALSQGEKGPVIPYVGLQVDAGSGLVRFEHGLGVIPGEEMGIRPLDLTSEFKQPSASKISMAAFGSAGPAVTSEGNDLRSFIVGVRGAGGGAVGLQGRSRGVYHLRDSEIRGGAKFGCATSSPILSCIIPMPNPILDITAGSVQADKDVFAGMITINGRSLRVVQTAGGNGPSPEFKLSIKLGSSDEEFRELDPVGDLGLPAARVADLFHGSGNAVVTGLVESIRVATDGFVVTNSGGQPPGFQPRTDVSTAGGILSMSGKPFSLPATPARAGGASGAAARDSVVSTVADDEDEESTTTETVETTEEAKQKVCRSGGAGVARASDLGRSGAQNGPARNVFEKSNDVVCPEQEEKPPKAKS